MLEVRNLVKVYKPKKGVAVKALDNVSIKFPHTGMVFLLGKSGSGKSTLLNVLGGLDRCDSGEIIIKGVSSRSFRQRHFDSYRNTYVGFVFQEYNLLEEFNVGANIALAIQLQGRKPQDDEINSILHRVDMEGCAYRRTNELSGGQRQRVAIARALVKNPEIIMADEPTGALDSATGRQVLQMLKELSQTRLVIVVSHDREFASQYADRIIELSDGRVIRDDERIADNAKACAETGLQGGGDSARENAADNSAAGDSAPGIASADMQASKARLTFCDNCVEIPAGYHLTPEDREKINSYIDSLSGQNTRLIIGSAKQQGNFAPTDVSRIGGVDSGEPFRLIRSHLPMNVAFRLGASSLKYKKFRLVVTVLLSCVAFTLFGLADTFSAYNHVRTCTDSLMDNRVEYISVTAGERNAETALPIGGGRMSQADIEKAAQGMGTELNGVYKPSQYGYGYDIIITDPETGENYYDYSDYSEPMSFAGQINSTEYAKDTVYNLYSSGFEAGFGVMEESIAEKMGYTLLAGRYPEGDKPEIAVSKAVYETFEKCGYREPESKMYNYTSITRYEDLIGKKLRLNGTDYTVSAIVDTGLDMSRYGVLAETIDYNDAKTVVRNMILQQELYYDKQYGYAGMAMLSRESFAKLVQAADEAYDHKPFEFAIGAMPKDKNAVLNAVKYCYRDGNQYNPIQNPVIFELDAIDEVLKVLSGVFVGVGIFFAIFAAIMLANFIAVSVANKKQEIGILRAIGSRSSDVFRIFFSESFIIAAVNFVLACIGTAAVTVMINGGVHNLGVLVTVLSVGPRQLLLMLAISLGVAAAASFFPVWRIAAKKPIDAIRNR